ncbi:MAG: DUF3795 domain-containing protein [Dehalococcoidales bacterium]|nr:MAG: DUF3795 domain-containing protein [Dehalococcoidales bacterium]
MAKKREELAYCGVDCEECNIYRAMVYGEELKPETIQRWQEDAKKYWRIDSLDPKDINCQGCRYDGEEVFYGFRLCPTRNCCKKQGLSSCGLCPEWKTCELLDGSGGKENLERIAAIE